MTLDSEKKVALVAGASSGIGRAVAEHLAGAGYAVAGIGRRIERFTDLPCRPYAADVADASAINDVFTRVQADFGRLDAVVNCAGIVRSTPFASVTDGEIAEQIDINLRGTIHVIRAALPMLKAARGAIVNVSSTLSQRPTPGVAIYAATKGAIEALTVALALELGPDGVRVNAVLPALVRSEIWTSAGMSQVAYDALLAARAKDYPLGRVGEPEDVAAMIAFLLSDKASWITGACIPLDGGSRLGVARRT